MFPRDIFIRFSLYPFADVGILVLPLSFGFLVIIAALGQAKLPQQQRQWVFIFKGINDHCLLPVFEGLRVDAGVFFNTLMVSFNISISICMPSIRASSCCISALGGSSMPSVRAPGFMFLSFLSATIPPWRYFFSPGIDACPAVADLL